MQAQAWSPAGYFVGTLPNILLQFLLKHWHYESLEIAEKSRLFDGNCIAIEHPLQSASSTQQRTDKGGWW